MSKPAALVLHGHVMDALKSLPDQSVHCVCTSPPYWGLREYAGAIPQIWGGDDACEHDWSDNGTFRSGRDWDPTKGKSPVKRDYQVERGDTCAKCGAFQGHLGLEPTFTRYIQNIVIVMREVKRVLRDDGILALNIGDCFGRDPKKGRSGTGKHSAYRGYELALKDREETVEKCKLLIPHRTAIAMIDDGWVLRMDNVWSKKNPLPESVDDRPTTAHEFIFLFSKQPKGYWWDKDAVREAMKPESYKRAEYGFKGTQEGNEGHCEARHGKGFQRNDGEPAEFNEDGRNMRSVIHIAAEPFNAKSIGLKDIDHFAAFPTGLVRPFILAGCPEKCCPLCGRGWVRETKRDLPSETSERPQQRRAAEMWKKHGLTDAHFEAIQSAGITDTERTLVLTSGAGNNSDEVTRLAAEAKAALGGYYREFLMGPMKHVSWKQDCKCEPAAPVPGTTMDPFAGTATTGVVALRHDRRAVLCEISADYMRIIRPRMLNEVGLFTQGGVEFRTVAK